MVRPTWQLGEMVFFFFFSQNGDEEIEMRVLGLEEHLESRSAVLLDFLGL